MNKFKENIIVNIKSTILGSVLIVGVGMYVFTQEMDEFSIGFAMIVLFVGIVLFFGRYDALINALLKRIGGKNDHARLS